MSIPYHDDTNNATFTSSSSQMELFLNSKPGSLEKDNVNPKLCCIVANIGAGKTDLIGNLRQHFSKIHQSNVELRDEPVKLWENIGLLTALYRDLPLENSATPYDFQVAAFSSRLVEYKGIDWKKTELAVIDGHVQIDREVFKANLLKQEKISSERDKWYETLYQQWQILVPEANPSIYIYLQCEPEICKQRIEKRGRPQEANIPLSYLQDLHKNFEMFSANNATRVLTLNVSNLNETEVLEKVLQILEFKLDCLRAEEAGGLFFGDLQATNRSTIEK